MNLSRTSRGLVLAQGLHHVNLKRQISNGALTKHCHINNMKSIFRQFRKTAAVSLQCSRLICCTKNSSSPGEVSQKHTDLHKPGGDVRSEDGRLSKASMFRMEDPEFDWKYLCDPDNSQTIQNNVLDRKGVGNIHKVVGLWNALQKETDPVLKAEINADLLQEARDIPNKTHPLVPVGDESCAKNLEMVGERREFNFTPQTVVKLGETLDCLRTSLVGHTTGPRSYYFKNAFAELEQALVRFTVNYLAKKGFFLVSVPDLLHPEVIEACGFNTRGGDVFKLDPKNHGEMCLSGTAEMALASLYMNEVFPHDNLPIKLAAASRCFRTETSGVQEEQGIYRVRQFTKVEMFGLTSDESGKESEDLFQHFVDIQKHIFTSLGLHFRVLDMPTQELGAPAYRKYDMETWMPAKQFWGEISSTSNCIDYQSRRMNIKYTRGDNSTKHVHTVNGTACAVPRMIMAIVENNLNEDGSVNIPDILQPYMRNQTAIMKPDKPLRMKWLKLRSK